MILYTAIILYILSVIIGLFLMATVKNISRRKFLSVASMHALSFLLFILTKTVLPSPGNEQSNNFAFLAFICSGLILAGLAWRSDVFILLKIYFSSFAITIFLFIFSPSRLMVFLLSGKYTETLGKTFAVGENFFLEQQNSSSDTAHYKLIRKQGMFHKLIRRDLVFKGTLDSIHVLEFVPGEKATIRGYSGKVTYVSTEIDSMDVEVKLINVKKDVIERKY